MNPGPLLQLDRVIHEKGRLAIMSLLAANAEMSFTELRDTLCMTDGNLTTHMRTLQEAGYVAITKSFRKNRPLTTCALTAAGRQTFAGYIDLLEQIVQQARGAEVAPARPIPTAELGTLLSKAGEGAPAQ